MRDQNKPLPDAVLAAAERLAEAIQRHFGADLPEDHYVERCLALALEGCYRHFGQIPPDAYLEGHRMYLNYAAKVVEVNDNVTSAMVFRRNLEQHLKTGDPYTLYPVEADTPDKDQD